MSNSTEISYKSDTDTCRPFPTIEIRAIDPARKNEPLPTPQAIADLEDDLFAFFKRIDASPNGINTLLNQFKKIKDSTLIQENWRDIEEYKVFISNRMKDWIPKEQEEFYISIKSSPVELENQV